MEESAKGYLKSTTANDALLSMVTTMLHAIHDISTTAYIGASYNLKNAQSV
jgi:hypothetical protein